MTRRNTHPLIGTWVGEEITATFTATGRRDWIGHPDVPGGMQECEAIEDVELHSVSILGNDVRLSILPDVVKDIIFEQHTEIEKWENAE